MDDERHAQQRRHVTRAAWGGGMIFDTFGNYDLAWRIGVLIGVVAGMVQILFDPEITRIIQVVTVHGRPHVPAVGAFVREVPAFPWATAAPTA